MTLKSLVPVAVGSAVLAIGLPAVSLGTSSNDSSTNAMASQNSTASSVPSSNNSANGAAGASFANSTGGATSNGSANAATGGGNTVSGGGAAEIRRAACR